MLLLDRHNITKEVIPHLDSTYSIHCPIVVTVPVRKNPKLTILFRTWTRHGSSMHVLDEFGVDLGYNRYDYQEFGSTYYNKMLSDFNGIVDCLDLPYIDEQDALKEAFKLAMMKTQSRYGREFEDSDFEMKLIFQ